MESHRPGRPRRQKQAARQSDAWCAGENRQQLQWTEALDPTVGETGDSSWRHKARGASGLFLGPRIALHPWARNKTALSPACGVGRTLNYRSILELLVSLELTFALKHFTKMTTYRKMPPDISSGFTRQGFQCLSSELGAESLQITWLIENLLLGRRRFWNTNEDC